MREPLVNYQPSREYEYKLFLPLDIMIDEDDRRRRINNYGMNRSYVKAIKYIRQ